MKSGLIFAAISLLAAAAAAAVQGGGVEPRAAGGYVQKPFGTASFTNSSGCVRPACGLSATGFTAAISQLAYGAPKDVGPGDACGRCFLATAFRDPYNLSYTGPFNSIIVRVTNLCAMENNMKWCNQTTEHPVNSFGQEVHFDMCPGADVAFFPKGHGALTGVYEEVSCKDHWYGTEGSPAWKGACLAPEDTPNWPAVGCGNQGTAPSTSGK